MPLIDNNDSYKSHIDVSHIDPKADLLTQISQIRTGDHSYKRNYFEQLQSMRSNDGRFYGRRCFGTLQKNSNGKTYMGQYWLKPNDTVSQHISMSHSCYCTVNTFKRGGSPIRNKKTGTWYYGYHHSEDLVVGLCGLYADLDAKKIGLSRGYEIAPYWRSFIKLAKLPLPSFVVDSAHGLHILWLFSSEIAVHKSVIKKMWQRVEDKFLDLLKHAVIKYIKGHYKNDYNLNTYLTRQGKFNLVDGKVNDMSRYLRVPTSYNCKNSHHHILVRTIFDGHNSYKFFGNKKGLYYDFVGKYLNHNKNTSTYSKSASQVKNHPNPNGEKVHSGVNTHADSSVKAVKRLGRYAFLYLDRIADYKTLIHLRNQWTNNGYRNEVLFQYAVAKAQLNCTGKEILRGTRAMNQLFNVPLPDDEVVGIARALNHKNYSNLLQYQYSNAYIMSPKHLNITDNEEKHMITLTGDKERGRRNHIAKLKSHHRVTKWRKLRGLAGRITKARWKRAKRIDKARYMFMFGGYSKSAIARKLHVSRMTISRWLPTSKYDANNRKHHANHSTNSQHISRGV